MIAFYLFHEPWTRELGYDCAVFDSLEISREKPMSQMNEIKETATEIAVGLRRLGPDRVVALSVHVSKELIAELEEKANKLVAQLESVE